MGVTAEPKLIVKKTFLEFVDPPPTEDRRIRAQTDWAWQDQSASDIPEMLDRSTSVAHSVSAPVNSVSASHPSFGPIDTYGARSVMSDAMPAACWLGGQGNSSSLLQTPPPLRHVHPIDSPAHAVETPSPFLCMPPNKPAVGLPMMNCGANWSTQPQFITDGPVPWVSSPETAQQSSVFNMQAAEPTWSVPKQDQRLPRTRAVGIAGVIGGARKGPHPFCQQGAGRQMDASVFDDSRTTVMLRNLPPGYNSELLLSTLDSNGFAKRYDFVYLPIDFNTRDSLGYAFVNLLSHAEALRLWSFFEDFSQWLLPCEKPCTLTWSFPHQGLSAHVERYRNSPVMHDIVPEDCKPMIFVEGRRIQFPRPTKPLKAPRLRTRP